MSDWKKILLDSTESLENSIKVLHEGGYRIALVVDDCKRLLGTVTDGDIRRALIKNYSMKDPIDKVMNIEPVTAKKTDTSKYVLETMRNKSLLHMPILDDDDVLVGLETLENLTGKTVQDNPVFIMAGGFGTRLQPLTEEKPKPLLIVGGKPILETILLQFIDSGFHNFFISTHYKAEMIRDYFGDGSNWGVSINYVHEDNPLGTAGSLGLLPKNLPNLPIILMNGDLLTRVDLEALLDYHNHNQGIATMCVRKYDFQVPYGVIKSHDYRITSIEEKPVHSFFVNAGIYILDSKLIQSISGNDYLDMPTLLNNNVKNGEVVNMFPIHEYWLDIGRKDHYNQAKKEIELL